MSGARDDGGVEVDAARVVVVGTEQYRIECSSGTCR